MVLLHMFLTSLCVPPSTGWHGEPASDEGRGETRGSVRIPIAFIREGDPVPQGKTCVSHTYMLRVLVVHMTQLSSTSPFITHRLIPSAEGTFAPCHSV